MAAELLLAARRCSECLMTRQRIVSRERAAELLRESRAADVHFQCHKGCLAGLNVHCRGVHDVAPSRAYRFALHFGIPVREIDADALEPAR